MTAIYGERGWSVLNEKWICICIIAAVVCVIGIIIYIRCLHHKKARARVRSRSDAQKLHDINEAIKPFGFAYDLRRDIFYSLKDAWQREMGYGKLYDEMAPVMNMIIDCEPIYFEYDNRRWMIELWKGQYGITTGAEVGIYVEEKRGKEKDPEDIFYQAVSDKEELLLSMTLYKNGKRLFQKEKTHWWLTGFRLGEFSYPGELMLYASIQFPNQEMQDAFIKGCFQAGYQPEDLHIRCNRVTLDLYHPKTPQHFLRGKFYCRFIQWQNRHNCKLYLHVTKAFTRTIDKVDYLMMAYPRIFRMLVKLGRIGWKKK